MHYEILLNPNHSSTLLIDIFKDDKKNFEKENKHHLNNNNLK